VKAYQLAVPALVAIAVPAIVHAQAIDPTARIALYNDAIIGVMKSKGGLAARTDKFEPIVREYYDMPTIAQLVVGPKWATSSAVDREAAIAALIHHSATSLARNFSSYSGEKFVIDPAVISRGASKVVRVTIISADGKNVLLYQMRQGPTGWKIVDVVSGGVSQLAVQRADVAGAVATGGAAGLARQLAKLDNALK
jgi:phospholipid transport system substrate-binding protein